MQVPPSGASWKRHTPHTAATCDQPLAHWTGRTQSNSHDGVGPQVVHRPYQLHAQEAEAQPHGRAAGEGGGAPKAGSGLPYMPEAQLLRNVAQPRG